MTWCWIFLSSLFSSVHFIYSSRSSLIKVEQTFSCCFSALFSSNIAKLGKLCLLLVLGLQNKLLDTTFVYVFISPFQSLNLCCLPLCLDFFDSFHLLNRQSLLFLVWLENEINNYVNCMHGTKLPTLEYSHILNFKSTLEVDLNWEREHSKTSSNVFFVNISSKDFETCLCMPKFFRSLNENVFFMIVAWFDKELTAPTRSTTKAFHTQAPPSNGKIFEKSSAGNRRGATR